MLASFDFQAQLASIMDILARTAVAEICKLFEDGSSVWKLEISKQQRENETLKRRLQLMENELWTSRRCQQHPGRVQDGFQLTDTQESVPEIKTERTEETLIDGSLQDAWKANCKVSVESRPQCDTEERISIESQHPFKDRNPHPTSVVLHRVPTRGTVEAAFTADPGNGHTSQRTEQRPSERIGRECQVYDRDVRDSDEGGGPHSPHFTEDPTVIEMENLTFHSTRERYSPTEDQATVWMSPEEPITHPLELPIRANPSEKQFLCMYCGKCFAYLSYLKRHLRIHTGEKPYSCKLCGKRFSSGSSRKKHENTHTGRRPFHCSQCGKHYSRRYHLKRHQKTHGGAFCV